MPQSEGIIETFGTGTGPPTHSRKLCLWVWSHMEGGTTFLLHNWLDLSSLHQIHSEKGGRLACSLIWKPFLSSRSGGALRMAARGKRGSWVWEGGIRSKLRSLDCAQKVQSFASLIFTSQWKCPLPWLQKAQVYSERLFVQERFSLKFWQTVPVKPAENSSTAALGMGFS